MVESAAAQNSAFRAHQESGPIKNRRADILHDAGIATEAMKASDSVHEAYYSKDQDAVFTPEVVKQKKIEISIASTYQL